MKASLTVLHIMLLILIALTGLSPAWYSAWALDADGLNHRVTSVFGKNTQVLTPVLQTGKESGALCLSMAGSQAQLVSCDGSAAEPVWKSPPEWQVEQAFFSDLNWDKQPELVLLVWRQFEPWPVDSFMPYHGRIDSFQDDNDRSCHLILINVDDGEFSDLWAGSAMAAPIHSLIAADLDGDGRQELSAIEYDYNAHKRTGSLVVWRWNSFGFSLAARQKGSFHSLQAIQSGKLALLLTQ